MSMIDIDMETQNATAEAVSALTEWVWEHLQSPDTAQPLDKEDWYNVFDTWFDCGEEPACPHDWIGEALHLRRAGVAMTNKIGDSQLEITALKDELMEKNARLIRQDEMLAARSLEIADLMDECIELRKEVRVNSNEPATTGIDADYEEGLYHKGDAAQEIPVNGYVQLNWQDGAWRKRGSLDEFIADHACSEIFELGNKLEPKKVTVWEVQND